jgi:long-chain acyl-CoA synthetase
MHSTLLAVAHYASYEGSRPAVRHSRGAWSYADLYDAARGVALGLLEANARVAALAADNGPEWLAVDLGAQLANVVLVPLAGYFSREQIGHALADSGADVLIAPRAIAERLTGKAEPGRALVGGLCLHELMPAAPAVMPAYTSTISYTSGTTGRPKGVCLSRRGMDAVAGSLCDVLEDVAVQRHLCVLPLATLLENVAGVYAPLQIGAEVIVPSLAEVGIGGATEFDPCKLLAAVEAHRPESVILLPQLLAGVIAAIDGGAAVPSSLRFIAVGGARVASTILGRADALGLPVYEGYGLTECGSVVALNSPQARRLGSVGKPLPHTAVSIDAQGEIHVGGPSVSGYTGSASVPEAIATGDLGRFDADGFLEIDGRRKNVFITSFGRNVTPDWVETELAAEPEIAQVAVFGEARPWNVAVVVPRGDRMPAATIQAAVERANRRLPDYARVHDWIYADQPFAPANGLATANGRNRRAAIAARYETRINARYDDTVERIA